LRAQKRRPSLKMRRSPLTRWERGKRGQVRQGKGGWDRIFLSKKGLKERVSLRVGQIRDGDFNPNKLIG